MTISRRMLLKTGLAGVPVLAASQPSTGFALTNCGPATPKPTFLRQVATGCHVPTTEYTGIPAFLFRTPHFNRAGLALNTIQIAVPNFISGFFPVTSPKTWRARIEYPLNNVTHVTWNNGSEEVTLNNDVVFSLSDPITLKTPIPDNAQFWVRLWQKDASGNNKLLLQDIGNSLESPWIPRTHNYWLGETNCNGNYDYAILDNEVLQDPQQGNVWSFTDGAGTYYWQGIVNAVTCRPLAILGQSRKPAFSLWGDSRMCGIADTFDSFTDDRGEVERSIGPAFAYINLGRPSMSASTVLGFINNSNSPANNPYLFSRSYTTNMIEDLGGGDCIGAANQYTGSPDLNTYIANSVANIVATKQQLWSIWQNNGQPLPLPDGRLLKASTISTLTIPPYTNSNPGGLVPTYNGFFQALSSAIMAAAGPAGVRLLDVASAVADIDCNSSQYTWINPSYTADNLHETQAGCLAIRDSGVIDPFAITR